MIRLALLLLPVLWVVSGCATHFVRENDGQVDLYLKAPQAREVLFASSLDGFTPRPARQEGSRTWRITLPKEGEFRYFYLVDGGFLLPDCPCRERDDFGSFNCLYRPGQ